MHALIEFPAIRPEIFKIPLFGMEFALRWYALAYIVGLLIGWRIVVGLMRKPVLWPDNRAPMLPTKVEDLLTAVILGVILGGRIGFVLFYQPGYYLTHPLEILRVWEGGMSFHGGFLGVVAAGLWFCRRHGVPMPQLADALALATPPGLLLGRIANFINAELWGRPTILPWGVAFPGTEAQTCPGITGLCARHPSQLYEAALEGLLLMAVLWALVYGRGWLKTPGRITGAFLAGYGFARFVVEFVRQADAQYITPDNPLGHALSFGAGFGLSMGQLLSLPMIAVGFWLMLRRRAAAGAKA